MGAKSTYGRSPVKNDRTPPCSVLMASNPAEPAVKLNPAEPGATS